MSVTGHGSWSSEKKAWWLPIGGPGLSSFLTWSRNLGASDTRKARDHHPFPHPGHLAAPTTFTGAPRHGQQLSTGSSVSRLCERPGRYSYTHSREKEKRT